MDQAPVSLKTHINPYNYKLKPPVLRENEEKKIVRFIIEKAKKGEPVLRQDVINMVADILKSNQRKNPFRNGVPGDKWFSLVRRRQNEEFKHLEPRVLRAVEKLGFTQKVQNTVIYKSYKTSDNPIRTHKREPVDPMKPRRRRRTPVEMEAARAAKDALKAAKVAAKAAKDAAKVATSQQPLSAALLSPPISEESCNTNATDTEMDTSRSQENQSESLTDFQPGTKLEVMDFNEKWYPVKVVEVDYEEGEVLVHFEKWSDIFDEWVRMDSNRIRRPILPQQSESQMALL